MALTVGEVSGLIAAGVFVLQVCLPLLIPFLLIAFLTEVNSVLTWATLGRYLQSSLWPVLLGTSTAASDGVQPRVTYTQWMQTGLLAVVSIASICTPLGLRDSIELAASTTPHEFGYLRDTSPFGTGTPSRSPGPFTRFCGTDQACPGQRVNRSCETVGLLEKCQYTYESRMPVDLLQLYNDGATRFSPTVSSIFDMQYRNYINGTDAASTLGWYVMPTYRHLSVLLLEDQDQPLRVVEGLVVNVANGGIGFRNHTAPKASLAYGASWSEDLLFIEPETQCVPLNLTVDFERPSSREVVYSTINTVLTDHGGLSQLSRTPPDLTVEENGQAFDLKERAYKAAWLNNFLTMAYFNATDPDPSDIRRMDVREGQSFELPRTATNLSVGYWNIRTSVSLGEYLDLMVNRDGKNASSVVNPHGVNSEDFLYAGNLCSGSSASSTPNINNTVIGCSIVYGAATRTDGGSDLIVQPGSKWSMPMYTCATALKASIKTVTFQTNGTSSLSVLDATSLTPKQYTQSSPPPTWGVESIPSQILTWARPTWGIVGPDAPVPLLSKYNISTTTAEKLYLPGWVDEISALRGRDPVPNVNQNLPGVDFYTQTLLRALSVYQQPSTPYGDYSGFTSMALYTKWQGLSRSARGVASIINLIWTDLSANAVVGTRGWGLRAVASMEGASSVVDIDEGSSSSGSRSSLRRRATGSSSSDKGKGEMVPVTVYERKIRYTIPFAIPAFVVVGVTLAILVGLIILAVMRRTGVARLRVFLERTSVGRLLAVLLLSGTSDQSWIQAVRDKKVRMTGETVVVENEDESLLRGEDISLQMK